MRPRPRRRPALAALGTLALVLGTMLVADGGTGAHPGRPRTAPDDDRVFAAEGSTIDLRQAAYRIEASPISATVSVETAAGVDYGRLPLLMLCGSASLPAGALRALRQVGSGLQATLTTAGGTVLETATLAPGPSSFTVRFECAASAAGSARWPVFFTDGRQALTASGAGVFLPDPTGPPTEAAPGAPPPGPGVSTARRRPFAPPPFQVQLQGDAGWMGVGLVQVPNATTMELAPAGGLAIDYRLGELVRSADRGAGGRLGAMVRFPAFVVTFAPDPMAGLSAYHAALVALGAAPPVSAAGRPLWWQQPMVDTWGEQMAEGAARGSGRFTGAWVRDFASQWRRRYGVDAITLVIDSRWQSSIGSPQPDPARFGGWAGMRALVAGLHRQGMRVLLWWPLWIRHQYARPPSAAQLRSLGAGDYVDPTAPGFPLEVRAAMQRLLGSGPGEVGADGLKLDWAYDLPAGFQDPAAGTGAAALFHYLDTIHTEAHLVRPDALIDSSAVAPQFAATTDTIRLYDGWSEAEWARRAAIVNAADPGALIDGDGWRAGPADIVRHLVASTVYGVPAIYFSDQWADRSAIPPGLAGTLGRIVSLSTLKGTGSAVRLPNGDWRYLSGGRMTAESLASNQALAVWTYSGCGVEGRLVSTVAGRLAVPLPGGGSRTLVASPGLTFRWRVPLPGCHGAARSPAA